MTPDAAAASEIDFPGTAATIPSNNGTGWVVHLTDLPRTPVQHGTGYARFHDHALNHHTDPTVLAHDVRALLTSLTAHTRDLQDDPHLAQAADVFLGNALNHTFDLTWASAPDLVVTNDHAHITITITGTALLLAMHPEQHAPLLTQLETVRP